MPPSWFSSSLPQWMNEARPISMFSFGILKQVRDWKKNSDTAAKTLNMQNLVRGAGIPLEAFSEALFELGQRKFIEIHGTQRTPQAVEQFRDLIAIFCRQQRGSGLSDYDLPALFADDLVNFPEVRGQEITLTGKGKDYCERKAITPLKARKPPTRRHRQG